MSGHNALPGRSVTSKIFSILEVFTGERTEWSLSDIARASGLPTSTVHRLIRELVEWGGLERTRRGDYTIGVRLWEVAARSTRTYGLRETALPFLQGLWETTHAHVLLAVLNGHQAILVEKISGTRDVPPVGRAGGRLPLHASAVGKVLLAHSDADFQQEVLQGSLKAYTAETITDPNDLRYEIARVRRTGTATSIEELTPNSASCAALVVGPPEIGIAAVSLLSTPGSRDIREMTSLVQSAARGLTVALSNTSPANPITPRLPRPWSKS
ncbi:IclR family transcriptional regulator domain-containing protein [Nocardia sp. R7R-8]|uniref:IclR family transcriptional regulator domain-containing protein n=1 Tax=Nocardia sp. R7R-8 TaxID=3459304 RepID=UPI00403E34C7